MKNSPTHSRSKLAALVLLTFAASALSAANALTAVPTRDKKIIRRWTLPGDPRGVAVGADGTVYAGLAQSQEVIAVDPATGAIKKRIVLDRPEIASTKELVTLRTNADRTRLYIANGSDESAVILSLPDLAVLREITMEGEMIRDAVPDPKGRYLYLLGRRVHVFDANGRTELRTLDVEEPMAIAAGASAVAVFSREDFGTAEATAVTLYETKKFARLSREPLQTDKAIEAALFAAGEQSLVAFSRDALFERATTARPLRASATRFDLADPVNSNRICLPEGSGPQVAALAGSETLVVYAERRCSASSAFSGSPHGVTPASLYGATAYAVAYDPRTGSLVATDRAGFLTVYRVPRAVVSQP